MMIASLIAQEIARRNKRRCVRQGEDVISSAGERHEDCSTCYTPCGNTDDLGLAEQGFRLITIAGQLHLRWACPSCGTDVSEETELLRSTDHARAIRADALCCKCRRTQAAGNWCDLESRGHPTEE